MIKAVINTEEEVIGIVNVEHGFRGFLTRMIGNTLTSVGRVIPKSKLTKKQKAVFDALLEEENGNS